MAFQEIELNMIPHGDMPSFYASQYETGRPIIINVMMGEDDFTCTDLFIELHARKVDDNIVTLEPDSVDGNQVTFVGTEQLFACPGKNLCELCLYADETKDTSLGSLNFFIEVEPDPLAGGLTSETQIYDLHQQIEEITQEVIGEDYYDKTEVDDLLDLKADKATTYTKSEVDTALNLKADKSDTYTKTQTDNLLNDKADKATTYTKTQVDNALALKANSADLATVATTGDYDDLLNKPVLPDMTQYYTKSEVDALIDDIFPTLTASGPIASFTTALTKPLVSVTTEPGATVVNRCGANLFGPIYRTGALINSSGLEVSFSGWNITEFIPVTPGRSYYLYGLTTHPNTYQDNFIFYDDTQTKNGYYNLRTIDQPLVIPSGVYYVKFSLADTDLSTCQFSLINNAAYEPYSALVSAPVADADTITTKSGMNIVFTDSGDITVQYKYMSM